MSSWRAEETRLWPSTSSPSRRSTSAIYTPSSFFLPKARGHSLQCDRPSHGGVSRPADHRSRPGRGGSQVSVTRPGRNLQRVFPPESLRDEDRRSDYRVAVTFQNPFVECLIGSIRRECLDHMIVLNEDHLQRILRGYLNYYHNVWPHKSLEKNSPLRERSSLRQRVRSSLLHEWAAYIITTDGPHKLGESQFLREIELKKIEE